MSALMAVSLVLTLGIPLVVLWFWRASRGRA